MAKEIKVTFEDGGIYEGFANTYTLDNSITYYFSFDRDYRVQLTNNAITLQEYRNAGAWYPIDIITKFELAEISGGGTGDATQQWVKDNFVLKSGDTMSGALKFDFGNGVVFSIDHASSTNRAQVTGNGGFYWENDDKKRTFSIISTTNVATLNLYKVNSQYSNIRFRDFEFGGSGNNRAISYPEFYNSDTNSTWLMSGKFQTNNNWFFKAGVYFDAWAYWRSNDIINTIIQNNGGIRVYNDKNIVVHEMAYDAETNYYSVYKYNGRDTVSNVGGQDPQYRITGFNNFANSIECYDKITIKTENQTTGVLLMLTRNSINLQNASDPNNNNRTIINTTQFYQYSGSKRQFSLVEGRIDIYNDKHLFLHSGVSGVQESYREYSYNAIKGYNKADLNITSDVRVEINAPNFYVIAPNGTNITSNYGNIVLQDSQGVYGRSSNTEVNTYIRNVSHNIIVQTSQTAASDARRDELTALLDLFKIVYNILEAAGIPGASKLAEYTSDTVLWIYDNQNGVLKPTVTKIRNLIHN